jgi:hypothetical protein
VGFVVGKAALGQDFSEYFSYPCQFSFHQLLHIHPSSRDGTISQLVADVPSGLSFTTPHGGGDNFGHSAGQGNNTPEGPMEAKMSGQAGLLGVFRVKCSVERNNHECIVHILSSWAHITSHIGCILSRGTDLKVWSHYLYRERGRFMRTIPDSILSML